MKKQIIPGVLITVFFLIVLTYCKQEVREEKIPVTTKSEVAKELYDKAIDAYKQVEIAEARELFNKAIEEDPDFFMACYQLAFYDLYFDNIDRFKEYAEKAVNIEAGLSEGEELLKQTLKKLLENENADVTAIGEELVGLYPNDENAYNWLSFYHYIIEDYESAAQTTKKAIEITDDPAPLYNSLGYAYMSLEKYDEAAEALDKYLELEPDLPNPYDSKGDYFMKVEEYGKAYESFMKAYDLDTNWTGSYNKALKAKALFDSLQTEE